MDSNPVTPRRHWFRFSLRMMLVVLTVLSVWLGWQAKIVRDRREAIADLRAGGGYIVASGEQVPGSDRLFAELPFWRLWLGDTAVVQIATPTNCSEEKTQELRRMFPEVVLFWMSEVRKTAVDQVGP